MDRLTGNVKALIERIGVLPSFLIAVFAFMLRNAQAWSFGAFSLNNLPGAWPHILAGVTGIGMALGLEILGSAAGGKWWMGKRQAINVRANTRIPKKERELQATAIEEVARLNLFFMFAGYGASIFAGVEYAISLTGATSIMNALGEGVVVVIMTLMIAYYAIFYEPEAKDPNKGIVSLALGEINNLVGVIGGRIKTGEHSNGDIRTLQNIVGPVAGSMLEPLISTTADVDYYDVPAIVKMIHRDERTVRRIVAGAFLNKPELGIMKKEKGRGYLVPETAMFTLFADDIAAVSKALRERTSSGQVPAETPLEITLAGLGSGHSPVRVRRKVVKHETINV